MRKCLLLLFLVACQSRSSTEQQAEAARDSATRSAISATNAHKPATTFFDSVLYKMDLTIAQIRLHTNIDSLYYTDLFSGASFAGDSILNFHSGITGVMLAYNDSRNCIMKFLLTYTPDKNNVDAEIVSSSCDIDESFGYSVRDFKILTDSTFATTEHHYPTADSHSPTIEESVWKIDKKGLFINTGSVKKAAAPVEEE